MAVGAEGQLENEDRPGNDFLFLPPSAESLQCAVLPEAKAQEHGNFSRRGFVGESVWEGQFPACRHGICLLLFLCFPLSFQMLLFQHLPGNLDRNHLV